ARGQTAGALRGGVRVLDGERGGSKPDEGGGGMSTSAAVSAGAGAGRRVVARRPALPGGRAVVGGFLVALAAVGGFAGWTRATADTRVRYLAASRDLPVGRRIGPGDLA